MSPRARARWPTRACRASPTRRGGPGPAIVLVLGTSMTSGRVGTGAPHRSTARERCAAAPGGGSTRRGAGRFHVVNEGRATSSGAAARWSCRCRRARRRAAVAVALLDLSRRRQLGPPRHARGRPRHALTRARGVRADLPVLSVQTFCMNHYQRGNSARGEILPPRRGARERRERAARVLGELPRGRGPRRPPPDSQADNAPRRGSRTSSSPTPSVSCGEEHRRGSRGAVRRVARGVQGRRRAAARGDGARAAGAAGAPATPGRPPSDAAAGCRAHAAPAFPRRARARPSACSRPRAARSSARRPASRWLARGAAGAAVELVDPRASPSNVSAAAAPVGLDQTRPRRRRGGSTRTARGASCSTPCGRSAPRSTRSRSCGPRRAPDRPRSTPCTSRWSSPRRPSRAPHSS